MSSLSDYTDVSIILDESGSMHHVKSEVISSINEFLREQQSLDKPVVVSIYSFNRELKTIESEVLAKNSIRLNENNYCPNWSTALYQSVGEVIENTGKRLAQMPEYKRPQRVVIVIYTDGEENSSQGEWSESNGGRTKLKNIIQRQQDVYNWQILFLGAGIDASVGTNIGIKKHMAYSVDKNTTGCNLSRMSSGVSSYAAGKTQELSYKVL